jgi:hypothetical protein
LAGEEEGMQVIEVLLVVTFAVVPAIAATYLFIDTLKEYLGYEVSVVTSPFL